MRHQYYLLSITAETVLMGEFGPGIVVFRHYDRAGPSLDFKNPPNILLHVVGRLPGTHNVQVQCIYI